MLTRHCSGFDRRVGVGCVMIHRRVRGVQAVGGMRLHVPRLDGLGGHGRHALRAGTRAQHGSGHGPPDGQQERQQDQQEGAEVLHRLRLSDSVSPRATQTGCRAALPGHWPAAVTDARGAGHEPESASVVGNAPPLRAAAIDAA